MRILKPGKLGTVATKNKALDKKLDNLDHVEVWDDFTQEGKKVKKKKTFEKGVGNRMYPSAKEEKSKDREVEEIPEDEREVYVPRTD